MAIAELHSKSGEEDRLTSDVFGAMKYLPPPLGLVPFLKRAETFDGKPNALEDLAVNSAIFSFWPRAEDREPDLFIVTQGGQKPIAVVVEAKFRSPKHNLEDVDTNRAAPGANSEFCSASVAATDGDQLADYFHSLIRGKLRMSTRGQFVVDASPRNFRSLRPSIEDALQHVPSDSMYLLYVTAHYALPRADAEETLDSLARRGVPKDAWSRLLWVNWQSAASVFEDVMSHEDRLSETQRDIILDTWSVLRLKDLLPYYGWGRLVFENVSSWSPLFVSSASLFKNVSASRLKLGEKTYFMHEKGERSGNRS